jgi:Lrp/AsnC family leucine-responsive transcriptional regulator
MSMSELGRRVDMSAPPVSERVQRLERAGVIRGYRLEVDPAALGFPVCAFVRVRPAPGQLPKVVDLAERLGQVSECHRITGEDCFLIKIHAADVPKLEEALDEFLRYGQTVTSIVVTTPVPDRPLPLPEVPTQ